MNTRAESWVAVGLEQDIPLRGARVVRTSRGDIAVFRTQSGAIHATEDRCPHKGGPLSQGIVHGEGVTCPLHNWVFDLSSGLAQGADVGCLRLIPVRSDGGQILLDLSAFRQSAAA